jgi:HAD superfamily hydrolase (TIGR01509 family)
MAHRVSRPKTPAPIRAVVFDCFGVLYEDAFKEFIEHYLPNPDDPARRHYYDLALASDRGHVPPATFYAELSALSGEDPAAIQHRLRDTSVLSRGVVALIQELSPQYKIGLLSNAERSFLDRFLANHDLERQFDTILASSETRYVKPERGIFDEMARRLQLPFAQTVFIDDSEANTSAATQYGLHAIRYRTPAHLRRDLGTLLK